jgi:type III pantothenate kinase
MILLIDIGNTRIKWAQLIGTALGEQSAAAHAAWTQDDLVRALSNTTMRPQRVLISNVGGAKIGEWVRNCAAGAWQITAEFIESTAQAGGVRTGYADPNKLGVDRWLAMIAAHALEQRAVCVVSVGTAMTIDAVDAAGQHLGGVIVPGPDLMLKSLLHNTSDLAQRSQQGSSTEAVFADNTLGAMQQGAVHALAALIERAFTTMRRETKDEPALLLTGGASARVASALSLSYKSIPDLVLRGLAVVAAQPGG